MRRLPSSPPRRLPGRPILIVAGAALGALAIAGPAFADQSPSPSTAAGVTNVASTGFTGTQTGTPRLVDRPRSSRRPEGSSA